MKIIFTNDIRVPMFKFIYDDVREHFEVILASTPNELRKALTENDDVDYIFGIMGAGTKYWMSNTDLLKNMFISIAEVAKGDINIRSGFKRVARDIMDLHRAKDIEFKKMVTSNEIKVPVFDIFTDNNDRPRVFNMTKYIWVWNVEKLSEPAFAKSPNPERAIFAGMAASPKVFHPLLDVEQDIDVSFLGSTINYGERKRYFEILEDMARRNNFTCKIFESKIGVGQFKYSIEEINKLYNRTKIDIAFAPTTSYGRKINLRTFEIPMAGGFQLMQYSPYIHLYFEEDNEIVCWKDKKDLERKIKYYLSHEEERKKIARAGYERAIKEHTWIKRFKYVIKEIEVRESGKS